MLQVYVSGPALVVALFYCAFGREFSIHRLNVSSLEASVAWQGGPRISQATGVHRLFFLLQAL